jgi:hypothetical protein
MAGKWRSQRAAILDAGTMTRDGPRARNVAASFISSARRPSGDGAAHDLGGSVPTLLSAPSPVGSSTLVALDTSNPRLSSRLFGYTNLETLLNQDFHQDLHSVQRRSA